MSARGQGDKDNWDKDGENNGNSGMGTKHVHFIGIGGIGVSALARYYLAKGNDVSGSDLSGSEITEALEKEGVQIFIGKHKEKNLPAKTDLVIQTVAVSQDNPELAKARKLGIEMLTYPEALSRLVKKHWTIAVCGAHGKGTTTALVFLILMEAGFDPSVIIGTNLSQLNGTNCRVGSSKYLVLEADEYRRVFLNYWPKAIIVTNIDKEHLDCFKDLQEIKTVFAKFITHLPKNGVLIINKDDKNIDFGLNGAGLKIKKYSLKQKKDVEKIRAALKIPGKHNVSNALGALTLARELGIEDNISFKGLSKYNGAWRRFEIIQKKPFVVISDYAHHPSEIKATLQATREKFPKRRVWAIFQPHQYQRTYYLFDELAHSFKDADIIVITEIYSVAGREKQDIKNKVGGEKLSAAIQKTNKNTFFVQDFKEIPVFLRKKIKKQDVVVVMGAGSVYKIVKNLVI